MDAESISDLLPEAAPIEGLGLFSMSAGSSCRHSSIRLPRFASSTMLSLWALSASLFHLSNSERDFENKDHSPIFTTCEVF
jgi:hypothetical protein